MTINKNSEKVLTPLELQNTLRQLDGFTTEFLNLREKVNSAYGDKGKLLDRKSQLETSIQLKESEAVMQIQGLGKSAYVLIEGEQVPMTNDTQRKAYMRQVTSNERQELAKIESKLQRIEIDLLKMRDEIQLTVQAATSTNNKALVQGNLLRYMSNLGGVE